MVFYLPWEAKGFGYLNQKARLTFCHGELKFHGLSFLTMKELFMYSLIIKTMLIKLHHKFEVKRNKKGREKKSTL